MHLYFACSDSEYDLVKGASPKANMLFSFYSLHKDPSFIKLDGRKYFLDSGAFSAYTQGIKIDIYKYIKFIKKTSSIWTVVNGLDVIGDYKTTAKNLETIEAERITPLPTFHTRSPLEELHRLCKRYDYLALGGLVPLAMKKREIRIWLDNCFAVIRQYWPKKIHGFGVNSYNLWLEYPFYSVDSTSWRIFSRRLARVFSFENGRLRSYPGLGRNGRDDNNLIRNHNPMFAIKYKDNGKTRRYLDRDVKIIQELIKASEYTTKVWESRGIVWKD